ncbi:MAG TPA: M20 family metallopeptidase [Clostridia bacterium]|nr:M20 family metallopeptidase [Clostridia bacterium]
MKDTLFLAVDVQRDDLIKMSDAIFDNPEYDGEEVAACKTLTDYLATNGFSVEIGTAGFKTAFRAEYKNGDGGPTIGILCEYDALRNLGHGCGHQMQGPACLGAAVALKYAVQDSPYTLVIYGTPAEETFGAKCGMIEKGCFKELDVALMMHGGPDTCTDVKCMALATFNVNFYGKGAHAALAPDKGKSAFDAMLAAFNGIEFLREHVPEDVKMHYTVTQLPGPANVVPAKTTGQFVLRSFSKKTLDSVIVRFKEIIQGAALIADVTYDVEEEKFLYNKIPVLGLNKLLMDNAALADAPRLSPPRERTGSTDFGNVMYEVPGSCIRVSFVPAGTASHTQEYVDAGKSDAAHNAVIYGAKAIAGASMDLIADPALMAQIKAEFVENKKKFL